jgi:hypothetical protein
MQRIRKSLRKESSSNPDKYVLAGRFYETDILRKAYELIMENSKFFYEELTDAFITAGEIQNLNSTEMFVE